MYAKLLINIKVSLAHCEELINDETQKWRITKYIKSMDSMMRELEEYDSADRNTIAQLNERCLAIKTAIGYVDPPEKQKLRSKYNNDQDNVIKEIRQLNNAKLESEIRKEMFDGNDHNGLRKRNTNENSENMEKYYTNIQEKLADEMLTLTQNLKEQTLTASKIIKKDTEVITKAAKRANDNTGSLHSESKKLDEHSKRACKCWMWMMIAIVIAVFISMVLFMKLMKKRK